MMSNREGHGKCLDELDGVYEERCMLGKWESLMVCKLEPG